METSDCNKQPSWYLSQMKGPADEEGNEVDQISSMSFDASGDFLATGDRGGRIVVFRRNDAMKQNAIYDVYGTFTSHEAGFDYLKSVEIEEKINRIEWLPKVNSSRCLLTTNDKIIKMWRVKELSKNDDNSSSCSNGSVPKPLKHSDRPFVLGTRVESSCRKTYANAHAFNINSLSVNSDQETFLSSDELRINLWNLQHTDQSFNIVDLKPPNMENLSEVITAAKFHPKHCATFIYSLSKAVIRLCDMRQRALCDRHVLQFEDDNEAANKSFFSEIINSINDVSFSNSGNFVLARDYLTLKIWDMRKPNKPLETFPVHDHFRAKLCALYENDCIFDKFECCWSPDDKYLLTGSYNNLFRVFNIAHGYSSTLQVGSSAMEDSTPLSSKIITGRSTGGRARDNEIPLDSIDLSKKVLHLNWHPVDNVLAVAATNNLYILQNHSLVATNNDSSDVSMNDNVENSSSNSTVQLNGFQFRSLSPVNMEIDEV